MAFDLSIAEQRLRTAARLARQSMWLLFLIAASLMMIVRRRVPARIGSIWILGCAVLALVLSFALHNVVGKVGHRNTEDKIVRDVKNFLETQPSLPNGQSVPAEGAVSPAVKPATDPFVS